MCHTFISLDELERCLAYIPTYGLPGMTDCLKGEELVFAATYTFQPIRIYCISEMCCKIGEELHTLTNEEVEPAVGSYDFRDVPDMIDRFIIWLVPSFFLYLKHLGSILGFLEDQDRRAIWIRRDQVLENRIG
ncbi:unnamed protein product [Brugia timori]|uniref:Uncharacterized protein n=1 Tax=Brugia timori TaxID=42155 RepID=A0A0R3QEG2_9BILA|nr:unnamed protein product [Brugia timori]